MTGAANARTQLVVCPVRRRDQEPRTQVEARAARREQLEPAKLIRQMEKFDSPQGSCLRNATGTPPRNREIYAAPRPQQARRRRRETRLRRCAGMGAFDRGEVMVCLLEGAVPHTFLRQNGDARLQAPGVLTGDRLGAGKPGIGSDHPVVKHRRRDWRLD